MVTAFVALLVPIARLIVRVETSYCYFLTFDYAWRLQHLLPIVEKAKEIKTEELILLDIEIFQEAFIGTLFIPQRAITVTENAGIT